MNFFERYGIKPREQQIRVLNKLAKNWSNFRFFVCALPTGTGKTYIATALADAIKSTYILTSTLQLQKQYEESWDEIVNLKGRSNYVCALNSQFRVDAAPCSLKKDLIKECRAACRCHYYNQKDAALASKAMITNPVFMLYSAHCGFAKEDSEWVEREAMIIDEAHNTEKHLVAFAECDIDIAKLEKTFDVDLSGCIFGDSLETNYRTIKEVRERLQRKHDQLTAQLQKMFDSSKHIADLGEWAATFSAVTSDKASELNKKLYSLDKAIQPIKVFFNTHGDISDVLQRWIIFKDPKKNSLKVTPTYASFLFEDYFGRLAKKFVFMSATPGSKSEFCKELGIPENECLYIEEDSPFDPDLSPVVIIPSIKLSKDVYEENVKKLPKIIDSILEEHRGQKGIIHGVNYDICTKIYESSKYRNRLTCRDADIISTGIRHKKMSNEDLIEEHKGKASSVLLSPSMMEGVDLYDELSEFQIIVKLPWGNLGDPRTKIKSQIDSDWYANDMWQKLLQASGRSTRHEKDKSVTYILDSNFKYFWKKWEHKLPSWFNNRLRTI